MNAAADSSAPSRRRPRFDRRFWCLNAGGWSLLAMTNVTAIATDLIRAGRPVDGLGLTFFYLAVFTPWFLITPVVFLWVHRFPPSGDTWPRLLLRYLPLTVPWLLFYVPAQGAILSIAQHGSLRELSTVLKSMPTNQWVVDGIYLVALVGVAAAAHQGRERRRREQQASELALANAALETRLSEARLEMLRAQLEPHFLYNALNSIAALARQGDSDTAVEAVGLLSELLRYATRAADCDRVLLSEEVDFAEAYWAFQRLRYGERLDFELEVGEDLSTAFTVPPLILQPLLENAIRHGVEAIEGPSRVELVARRHGDRAELSVSNFPGRGDSEQTGLGVGLKNVRERLQWFYRQPVTLEIGPENGGFVARLELPSTAQTNSQELP